MLKRGKRYVTPGTAARRLGCSARTVRRWCNSSIKGEKQTFSDVWQSVTGRFWINSGEITTYEKSNTKKSSD